MSYPSVFIALNLILIATSETTIINELRQFLFNELLNFRNGLL